MTIKYKLSFRIERFIESYRKEIPITGYRQLKSHTKLHDHIHQIERVVLYQESERRNSFFMKTDLLLRFKVDIDWISISDPDSRNLTFGISNPDANFPAAQTLGELSIRMKRFPLAVGDQIKQGLS